MNPNAPRDRDVTGRRPRPVIETLGSRDLPASHPLGPACRGGTIPRRTSSNSSRSSIRPARPSRPRPRSSASRSYFKGVGRYTIGPGRLQRPVASRSTATASRGPATCRDAFHFQFVITEPSSHGLRARWSTGDINFVGRQFPPEWRRPDPRLRRPEGQRGQRPADPPLLGVRRQPVQLGTLRRDRHQFPASSNFPTNYFNGPGRPRQPAEPGPCPHQRE